MSLKINKYNNNNKKKTSGLDSEILYHPIWRDLRLLCWRDKPLWESQWTQYFCSLYVAAALINGVEHGDSLSLPTWETHPRDRRPITSPSCPGRRARVLSLKSDRVVHLWWRPQGSSSCPFSTLLDCLPLVRVSAKPNLLFLQPREVFYVGKPLKRGKKCSSLRQQQRGPKTFIRDKNNQVGTSPVVQWLRLCLPMKGVQVQSLVRELRYHMPQGQKSKT